jgi:hypothetical protein
VGAKIRVLASRDDQLGGRLMALTNARAAAELLEGAFEFVWPAHTYLSDPTQFFDTDFLATHLLDEQTLEGLVAVDASHVHRLQPEEIRAVVAAAGDNAFLHVQDPFTILEWCGESAEVAANRFRRAFADLGWNASASHLIATAAAWPADTDLSAVHVRAGDIVTGDWQDTVQHEKYVPSEIVEHAVRDLAGSGPVVMFSDNADWRDWLAGSIPGVVTSAEVFPGPDDLSEAQQAFADILLMARCRRIAGPPASGFSSLAANLGGGQLVRIDSIVTPSDSLRLLRRGIGQGRWRATRTRWRRPLLARDICWLLDVFPDLLSLGTRRRLARRAVRCEPTFVGALTRSALLEALTGRWPLALRRADGAVRYARQAAHPDDPLFEALVARQVVLCLQAAAGRSPFDNAEFERIHAECEQLRPNWVHGPRALDLLRQIAHHCQDGARHFDADTPVRQPGEPSIAEQHQQVRTYDPLVPMLRWIVRGFSPMATLLP